MKKLHTGLSHIANVVPSPFSSLFKVAAGICSIALNAQYNQDNCRRLAAKLNFLTRVVQQFEKTPKQDADGKTSYSAELETDGVEEFTALLVRISQFLEKFRPKKDPNWLQQGKEAICKYSDHQQDFTKYHQELDDCMQKLIMVQNDHVRVDIDKLVEQSKVTEQIIVQATNEFRQSFGTLEAVMTHMLEQERLTNVQAIREGMREIQEEVRKATDELGQAMKLEEIEALKLSFQKVIESAKTHASDMTDVKTALNEQLSKDREKELLSANIREMKILNRDQLLLEVTPIMVVDGKYAVYRASYEDRTSKNSIPKRIDIAVRMADQTVFRDKDSLVEHNIAEAKRVTSSNTVQYCGTVNDRSSRILGVALVVPFRESLETYLANRRDEKWNSLEVPLCVITTVAKALSDAHFVRYYPVYPNTQSVYFYATFTQCDTIRTSDDVRVRLDVYRHNYSDMPMFSTTPEINDIMLLGLLACEIITFKPLCELSELLKVTCKGKVDEFMRRIREEHIQLSFPDDIASVEHGVGQALLAMIQACLGRECGLWKIVENLSRFSHVYRTGAIAPAAASSSSSSSTASASTESSGFLSTAPSLNIATEVSWREAGYFKAHAKDLKIPHARIEASAWERMRSELPDSARPTAPESLLGVDELAALDEKIDRQTRQEANSSILLASYSVIAILSSSQEQEVDLAKQRKISSLLQKCLKRVSDENNKEPLCSAIAAACNSWGEVAQMTLGSEISRDRYVSILRSTHIAIKCSAAVAIRGVIAQNPQNGILFGQSTELRQEIYRLGCVGKQFDNAGIECAISLLADLLQYDANQRSYSHTNFIKLLVAGAHYGCREYSTINIDGNNGDDDDSDDDDARIIAGDDEGANHETDDIGGDSVAGKITIAKDMLSSPCLEAIAYALSRLSPTTKFYSSKQLSLLCSALCLLSQETKSYEAAKQIASTIALISQSASRELSETKRLPLLRDILIGYASQHPDEEEHTSGTSEQRDSSSFLSPRKTSLITLASVINSLTYADRTIFAVASMGELVQETFKNSANATREELSSCAQIVCDLCLNETAQDAGSSLTPKEIEEERFGSPAVWTMEYASQSFSIMPLAHKLLKEGWPHILDQLLVSNGQQMGSTLSSACGAFLMHLLRPAKGDRPAGLLFEVKTSAEICKHLIRNHKKFARFSSNASSPLELAVTTKLFYLFLTSAEDILKLAPSSFLRECFLNTSFLSKAARSFPVFTEIAESASVGKRARRAKGISLESLGGFQKMLLQCGSGDFLGVRHLIATAQFDADYTSSPVVTKRYNVPEDPSSLRNELVSLFNQRFHMYIMSTINKRVKVYNKEIESRDKTVSVTQREGGAIREKKLTNVYKEKKSLLARMDNLPQDLEFVDELNWSEKGCELLFLALLHKPSSNSALGQPSTSPEDLKKIAAEKNFVTAGLVRQILLTTRKVEVATLIFQYLSVKALLDRPKMGDFVVNREFMEAMITAASRFPEKSPVYLAASETFCVFSERFATKVIEFASNPLSPQAIIRTWYSLSLPDDRKKLISKSRYCPERHPMIRETRKTEWVCHVCKNNKKHPATEECFACTKCGAVNCCVECEAIPLSTPLQNFLAQKCAASSFSLQALYFLCRTSEEFARQVGDKTKASLLLRMGDADDQLHSAAVQLYSSIIPYWYIEIPQLEKKLLALPGHDDSGAEPRNGRRCPPELIIVVAGTILIEDYGANRFALRPAPQGASTTSTCLVHRFATPQMLELLCESFRELRDERRRAAEEYVASRAALSALSFDNYSVPSPRLDNNNNTTDDSTGSHPVIVSEPPPRLVERDAIPVSLLGPDEASVVRKHIVEMYHKLGYYHNSSSTPLREFGGHASPPSSPRGSPPAAAVSGADRPIKVIAFNGLSGNVSAARAADILLHSTLSEQEILQSLDGYHKLVMDKRRFSNAASGTVPQSVVASARESFAIPNNSNAFGPNECSASWYLPEVGPAFDAAVTVYIRRCMIEGTFIEVLEALFSVRNTALCHDACPPSVSESILSILESPERGLRCIWRAVMFITTSQPVAVHFGTRRFLNLLRRFVLSFDAWDRETFLFGAIVWNIFQAGWFESEQVKLMWSSNEVRMLLATLPLSTWVYYALFAYRPPQLEFRDGTWGPIHTCTKCQKQMFESRGAMRGGGGSRGGQQQQQQQVVVLPYHQQQARPAMPTQLEHVHYPVQQQRQQQPFNVEDALEDAQIDQIYSQQVTEEARQKVGQHVETEAVTYVAREIQEILPPPPNWECVKCHKVMWEEDSKKVCHQPMCNKGPSFASRHHCRSCGYLFCGDHCHEKTVLLPVDPACLTKHGSNRKKERVCDHCHLAIRTLNEYQLFRFELVKSDVTIPLEDALPVDGKGGGTAASGALRRAPSTLLATSPSSLQKSSKLYGSILDVARFYRHFDISSTDGWMQRGKIAADWYANVAKIVPRVTNEKDLAMSTPTGVSNEDAFS